MSGWYDFLCNYYNTSHPYDWKRARMKYCHR